MLLYQALQEKQNENDLQAFQKMCRVLFFSKILSCKTPVLQGRGKVFYVGGAVGGGGGVVNFCV